MCTTGLPRRTDPRRRTWKCTGAKVASWSKLWRKSEASGLSEHISDGTEKVSRRCGRILGSEIPDGPEEPCELKVRWLAEGESANGAATGTEQCTNMCRRRVWKVDFVTCVFSEGCCEFQALIAGTAARGHFEDCRKTPWKPQSLALRTGGIRRRIARSTRADAVQSLVFASGGGAALQRAKFALHEEASHAQ